jgi:hypothetical protein
MSSVPSLMFHVQNPDEGEAEVSADEVDEAEDADVDERPAEGVGPEEDGPAINFIKVTYNSRKTSMLV